MDLHHEDDRSCGRDSVLETRSVPTASSSSSRTSFSFPAPKRKDPPLTTLLCLRNAAALASPVLMLEWRPKIASRSRIWH